jgi:hypothetical protein
MFHVEWLLEQSVKLQTVVFCPEGIEVVKSPGGSILQGVQNTI